MDRSRRGQRRLLVETLRCRIAGAVMQMHDQSLAATRTDEAFYRLVEKAIPRRFIELDVGDRVGWIASLLVKVGDLAASHHVEERPGIRWNGFANMPRAKSTRMIAESPAGAAALAYVDGGSTSATLAVNEDGRAGERRSHDGAIPEQRRRVIDHNTSPATAGDFHLEIEGGGLSEGREGQGENHAHSSRALRRASVSQHRDGVRAFPVSGFDAGDGSAGADSRALAFSSRAA